MEAIKAAWKRLFTFLTTPQTEQSRMEQILSQAKDLHDLERLERHLTRHGVDGYGTKYW